MSPPSPSGCVQYATGEEERRTTTNSFRNNEMAGPKWKCCTQYTSKFAKLSSGHRTGKKMRKQWKQCQTLFFGAPKSLQMVIAAMK